MGSRRHLAGKKPKEYDVELRTMLLTFYHLASSLDLVMHVCWGSMNWFGTSQDQDTGSAKWNPSHSESFQWLKISEKGSKHARICHQNGKWREMLPQEKVGVVALLCMAQSTLSRRKHRDCEADLEKPQWNSLRLSFSLSLITGRMILVKKAWC